MKFLRKTVKQINPSTILSFGEIWNNMVALSLKGMSYHQYVSDRCKPDKSLGLIHNYLRRWLYKDVEGIIAQTEYAKTFFSNLTTNKKIEVIGNPVKPVGAATEERKNIVLSVGRLIDTKHYNRLIRIFAEIGKPGWELVIVGGNALKQNNKQKLESLVDKLGASDFIHLEGEQREVASYYRRASIFTFTSSSEGFPNVIGEALSAGLPVISYDCISGPSDLINHGKNGYLVKVFDDKQFKKHLLRLMEDEKLRKKMAAEAVNSIQYYSQENIAPKFLHFITSHL